MSKWGILLVALLCATGCKSNQAKNDQDMQKACQRARDRGQEPEVKQVSTLKVPSFGRAFNLLNFVGHNSGDRRVAQMSFSLRNVPPGFSASLRGGTLTLKPESTGGDAPPPQGQVEVEAKDACGSSSTVSLSVQSAPSSRQELFDGFSPPATARAATPADGAPGAPFSDTVSAPLLNPSHYLETL